MSAKRWRIVGEVSVNEKLYRPRHIWNDYRPCLDRVSSDYRSSLDRLSTAISTDRSVETTYSKHDPNTNGFNICALYSLCTAAPPISCVRKYINRHRVRPCRFKDSVIRYFKLIVKIYCMKVEFFQLPPFLYKFTLCLYLFFAT